MRSKTLGVANIPHPSFRTACTRVMEGTRGESGVKARLGKAKIRQIARDPNGTDLFHRRA